MVLGNAPIRVNKNYPHATTIMNITLVVFSEFFLKVTEGGKISILLPADLLTIMTNKCLAVLRNRFSKSYS